MKVEIELIEGVQPDGWHGGWKVTYGDKYADSLTYDEMLGVVASITMPEKRPCLQWLKTEDEHNAFSARISSSAAPDPSEFED